MQPINNPPLPVLFDIFAIDFRPSRPTAWIGITMVLIDLGVKGWIPFGGDDALHAKFHGRRSVNHEIGGNQFQNIIRCPHKSFDVVLRIRSSRHLDPLNMAGAEDEYFTSFGLAKMVGNLVHQNLIPGINPPACQNRTGTNWFITLDGKGICRLQLNSGSSTIFRKPQIVNQLPRRSITPGRRSIAEGHNRPASQHSERLLRDTRDRQRAG